MVSRYGNSKIFSLSARLASGDTECVSGTIAGSFELKQSKMAIHKEETKDLSPGAFRTPTKTPAKMTPSTMLPRRAVPGALPAPKNGQPRQNSQ
jgi:hypothetical protein